MKKHNQDYPQYSDEEITFFGRRYADDERINSRLTYGEFMLSPRLFIDLINEEWLLDEPMTKQELFSAAKLCKFALTLEKENGSAHERQQAA